MASDLVVFFFFNFDSVLMDFFVDVCAVVLIKFCDLEIRESEDLGICVFVELGNS